MLATGERTEGMIMREKMVDVQAQRDEYRNRLHVAEDIVRALAKGEIPDVEDRCVLDDGTSYHFRVFGIDRANGGTILIAVSTGADQFTSYDVQGFEVACEHARVTATYSDKAWPYRDAFDRMRAQVRKHYAKGA